LAELQNQNRVIDIKLNSAKFKLRLFQERQNTQDLKIRNREGHIQFLEAAIRDYQKTFRTRVEESNNQIQSLREKLQNSVLRIRSSSGKKVARNHSLRVPKPIRGCRRLSL